jgi:hypothetical protein
MPEKRYTKVEEEIIQILDRLEHEEPAGIRPNLRLVSSRPARRQRRRFRLPVSLPTSLPTWFWLALALGLALVAYLTQGISQPLTLLLAVGSMLAFIWPLIARLRSGAPGGIGPQPTTKTWRGKDITLGGPTGGSSADRARRWLDDKRGGPRRFK